MCAGGELLTWTIGKQRLNIPVLKLSVYTNTHMTNQSPTTMSLLSPRRAGRQRGERLNWRVGQVLVKLAEDSLNIYQNIIKITTEGSTQFCVIGSWEKCGLGQSWGEYVLQGHSVCLFFTLKMLQISKHLTIQQGFKLCPAVKKILNS